MDTVRRELYNITCACVTAVTSRHLIKLYGPDLSRRQMRTQRVCRDSPKLLLSLIYFSFGVSDSWRVPRAIHITALLFLLCTLRDIKEWWYQGRNDCIVFFETNKWHLWARSPWRGIVSRRSAMHLRHVPQSVWEFVIYSSIDPTQQKVNEWMVEFGKWACVSPEEDKTR